MCRNSVETERLIRWTEWIDGTRTCCYSPRRVGRNDWTDADFHRKTSERKERREETTCRLIRNRGLARRLINQP